MSNEEIAVKIQQYQHECEKALQESGANFALNQIIVENKNKIKALRQQCSHKENDGTLARNVLGKCKYCGATIR